MSLSPILTRLEEWEVLYLHIIASKEAMGTVLIDERNVEKKPMYYTSKALHGAEVRY